jgi:guanine deaminase
VHSPQLDVIASYGTELLDWLDTYTFPAERAMPTRAKPRPARRVPRRAAGARHDQRGRVPDRAQGVADALFAAGAARGMRLIAGKVLMDRNAPDGLRDDASTRPSATAAT